MSLYVSGTLYYKHMLVW